MTKNGATAAQTAQPAKKAFSLISDEKLIALYSQMLRCRMLDERVQKALRADGLNGNHASSMSHEATLVGVAINLLPEDAIGPTDFDFIANFVKGASLAKIPCQLKPVEGGGRTSLSESSASLVATGLALANKNQSNNKIVVAFLGRASTASCHEALQFAGAHQLPILFVFHESQQANEIELVAPCVPRITVDGDDVVAVYRVACEAITHARKGNGPTLIECKSFSLDGQSLRGRGMHREANKKECPPDLDPILNMEEYLAGKGLFHASLKDEIAASFALELDAALGSVGKAQSPGRRKRPTTRAR